MQFPTTHWTALAVASCNGDTPARTALDGFCRAYRSPILATILAAGVSLNDAEDYCHGFLIWLIDRSHWKRAEKARGRFRVYLRGALNFYLRNELRKERVRKRSEEPGPATGNGTEESPEEELVLVTNPPTDALFDRAWALQLLGQVFSGLEREYSERGMGAEFQELKKYLSMGDSETPYAEVALRLGITASQVAVKVRRMRVRLSEGLKAAVAPTVSAPHEIDGELRHLRAILASPSITPGMSESP